jgi:hypothetical protein
MNNTDNADTNRILFSSSDEAQPRQLRYIDKNTPSYFQSSALPSNISSLIQSEQKDREICTQIVAVCLILLIIMIFLVWLERRK